MGDGVARVDVRGVRGEEEKEEEDDEEERRRRRGGATRSALAKVVLSGETDYERWTNNERGILVSVRRDIGADLDLIGEVRERRRFREEDEE